MKRKNHLMFYLTLLICAIMPLGFASFDILAGETSQATPTLDDTVTKVCYNDTTNKQYTTIEMALKEANSGETIYVIPNPDGVSIYNDCVIKEGVTLNLPYSITYDASTNTYSNPISFASTYGSASSLSYTDSARKSLLILEDGATLTNYGEIFIGGIQTGGQGGTYYSGSTQGSFSELKINKNALLDSYGSITSYGYISGIQEIDNNTGEMKSVSDLILRSSGKLTLPFIVVEHRGGSVFMGMAAENSEELVSIIMKLLNGNENTSTEANLQTSPFNRFLFHNIIDLNYVFYAGSEVYGAADLYADNQNNQATVKLIGYNDNAFFISLTNENSFIKGWLNSNTLKNSINIYGDMKLNNLTLSLFVNKSKSIVTVKGYINMSTAQIYFPIPYYFDISLNPFTSGMSSHVDLTAQKIKILPGVNFLINSGVTVDADSIAIYTNDNFYTDGIYYVTGNVGNSLKYPDTSDAYFLCNGVLNVNSIGGIINKTVTSQVGTVNISNNNYVSVKEIYSSVNIPLVVTVAGTSITIQNYDSALYKSIELTAKSVSITGSSIDLSTLYSNTTYKTMFLNGQFVYYTYTLTFVNVSNDAIDFNEYEIINPNYNYFVPNSTNPLLSMTYNKVNDNSSDINFIGYFVDQSCTKSISILDNDSINDYINNDNLTIYAKWQKVKKGITIIVEDINGSGTQYSYLEVEDNTTSSVNLPKIFTKEKEIEGGYGTGDSITITTFKFDGWTVDGGVFSDGNTSISGTPPSVSVSGNAGSIITIKPKISSTSIVYNRIDVKYTYISDKILSDGAETSAKVTISNFISDQSLSVTTNATTFEFKNKDKTQTFYAPLNSIISIDYKGEYVDRWLVKYYAWINVSFIGFTDNTRINDTYGSGNTKRITNSSFCQISFGGRTGA